MAKLVLGYFLLVLGLTLTCNIAATTYTVGDNSGWDISTDLDSWVQGKKFVVGDVLSKILISCFIYYNFSVTRGRGLM